MPDNDDFDFSGEFTKANANLDYIAAQFADVIRHLMRAISSDDPSSGIYNATRSMNSVAELLSKTEEKFGFYQLFSKALEEFRDDVEWGTSEHDIVHTAHRGIKYIVERSCTDNAARGRASRRRDEFLSATRMIEEMREYRRRNPRAGI